MRNVDPFRSRCKYRKGHRVSAISNLYGLINKHNQFLFFILIALDFSLYICIYTSAMVEMAAKEYNQVIWVKDLITLKLRN
jgi:hypothetical protein